MEGLAAAELPRRFELDEDPVAQAQERQMPQSLLGGASSTTDGLTARKLPHGCKLDEAPEPDLPGGGAGESDPAARVECNRRPLHHAPDSGSSESGSRSHGPWRNWQIGIRSRLPPSPTPSPSSRGLLLGRLLDFCRLTKLVEGNEVGSTGTDNPGNNI
ncbi:hypothetical protein E2562_010832 [Oryza meyeriana var. granulata]|uniref:Uncharacterized protein n=1 Tax=Oryza meyeriana var. granulata TaxID=110450 RepID=A0A6G1BJG4_9ORYZ|nr:hypothetical protein E2562_010832 [Oryza meyeriana var. granulata]